MYRVAQKSLNVASLFLNTQYQGTFSPHCMLMAFTISAKGEKNYYSATSAYSNPLTIQRNSVQTNMRTALINNSPQSD